MVEMFGGSPSTGVLQKKLDRFDEMPNFKDFELVLN